MRGALAPAFRRSADPPGAGSLLALSFLSAGVHIHPDEPYLCLSIVGALLRASHCQTFCMQGDTLAPTLQGWVGL